MSISIVKSAVYHGPIEKLQGEKCLVRDDQDDETQVLVQFDDVKLMIGGTCMGRGWHTFAKKNFTIKE